MSAMSQAKSFLKEVEGFLRRSKMAPTTFGIQALGDPSFIRNLREGRVPSLKTADRILSFIRSQEADANQ